MEMRALIAQRLLTGVVCIMIGYVSDIGFAQDCRSLNFVGFR